VGVIRIHSGCHYYKPRQDCKLFEENGEKRACGVGENWKCKGYMNKNDRVKLKGP